MKRIIVSLISTTILIGGLLGFLFVGKTSAEAICFISGGSPVACSTVTGLGADTSNIQPNKCYKLKDTGGKSVFVEVDCSNPTQEIGSSATNNTDYHSPKYKKNDCEDPNIDKSNCGIVQYLVIFINILSALVGVVVVAMIIIGGIQYSSAGDDPQKVMAAKSKISNAILALVVFIFMYAFLQWVVPGGVF